MDLKHKAAEELAKMGAWSQDSLGYAREHGQRQLVWLLETVRGEVELEDALLALPSGEHLRRPARGSVWKKPMHKGQRVADMAPAALRRQARAAAERTGEPFEEALKAVLETEAGLQLRDLSDGPHRDESAERWQEDMAHKRARERARERSEREKWALRAAAWESFVDAERRELELRKEGQLAGLLGEPLPAESPAASRACLRGPEASPRRAGGAHERREGVIQAPRRALGRGHACQDRSHQVAGDVA